MTLSCPPGGIAVGHVGLMVPTMMKNREGHTLSTRLFLTSQKLRRVVQDDVHQLIVSLQNTSHCVSIEIGCVRRDLWIALLVKTGVSVSEGVSQRASGWVSVQLMESFVYNFEGKYEERWLAKQSVIGIGVSCRQECTFSATSKLDSDLLVHELVGQVLV